MNDQALATDMRNLDVDDSVLAQIVDAMLAVQSDLKDASVEDWSRTLVASCRRQKRQDSKSLLSMASTC